MPANASSFLCPFWPRPLKFNLAMTFEQPASLNRYVAPSGQSTWSFRWNLFKLFLPGFVFIAALIFQTILLQDWMKGRWEPLPFLVIPGVLILIFFSIEIPWRISAKQKKILELEENCILMTGHGLVPWQQVVAWQFNNLADEKNYRVATVEYAAIKYKWGPQRRKRLRRASIVLERSQTAQLISEVTRRRQKDNLAFSIVDGESNFIPKAFQKIRMAKMCVDAAGALLFMEGFLLFMGSLGLKDDSPDPDFVPNPNGSFTRFIRSHFSSGVEFQNFLFVTGLILCGAGLVLIIWSRLVLREKIQPTDATDDGL
jgi:hypothetical protein